MKAWCWLWSHDWQERHRSAEIIDPYGHGTHRVALQVCRKCRKRRTRIVYD
jgi:hypothetical protein